MPFMTVPKFPEPSSPSSKKSCLRSTVQLLSSSGSAYGLSYTSVSIGMASDEEMTLLCYIRQIVMEWLTCQIRGGHLIWFDHSVGILQSFLNKMCFCYYPSPVTPLSGKIQRKKTVTRWRYPLDLSNSDCWSLILTSDKKHIKCIRNG